MGAKAARYGRRAGDRALGRLAYEEAAEHYRRVLAILDPDDPALQEERAEVLLGLGRAQWSAGERAGARRCYDQVATLARRLQRPELLAEAAVAQGGKLTWNETGRVDSQLVAILEEALTALPQGATALRAKVAVRLATELYFRPDAAQRRLHLAEEALTAARRLGEPTTLAYVLNGAHFALWYPGNTDQRLAMSRELVDLARRTADRESELVAHGWLFVDLCEVGDLMGAAAAGSREAELSEELGQPEARWVSLVHRAFLALAAGRLDEAESLAGEALSIGLEAQVDAAQIYGVHQFGVRRLRGGLEELEPIVKARVEEFPNMPTWRSALAYLYRELGWDDKARDEFEVIKAHGALDLPFDADWSVGMAMLATVCNLADDKSAADLLYHRLLPFADSVVTVGAADAYGSVHTFLALLAATLENWGAFETHAAEALQRNETMGFGPWTAITQYEVARTLVRRKGPDDMDRAGQLLGDCLKTCQRYGLTALEARARAI